MSQLSNREKGEFLRTTTTSDPLDEKTRNYAACLDRARRRITAADMDLIDSPPDLKNAQKLINDTVMDILQVFGGDPSDCARSIQHGIAKRNEPLINEPDDIIPWGEDDKPDALQEEAMRAGLTYHLSQTAQKWPDKGG